MTWRLALNGSPPTVPRWRPEDIRETIWLTRPDLREMLKGDEERLDWWLLLNGAGEYRAVAEEGRAVPRALLETPAAEAAPGETPTLTRFMRLVWDMRPDLQPLFDLKTPAGREGFVWWYFVHGLGELSLGEFLTETQRAQLNAADSRVDREGGFLPVSRLMVEVWRRRADVQQAFDPRTPAGRTGFLSWYFGRGLGELSLEATVDRTQARALLTKAPDISGIARVLALLWTHDDGLRERFPDPGEGAFRRWAETPEAGAAYPILARLMVLSGRPGPSAPAIHRAPVDLTPGVNLIGYARGQLGIGEDTRMAARACAAAGIPFSVYNVDPGRDVCQGDDSLAAHVSDRLPHAVNLFCMTGIETARLAAVMGSRLFDGRRSIGSWPWELPEWPKDWLHAYDLIDEVWASSRFTYEAYGRSCPKPVRHMPMAVTVDDTAGRSRRDFRLPDNRFLFVFSFDFLSSLVRKNPQAVVTAFRRAFPRGDEPVGLVVKAMRATPDNPLWQALLVEARVDGRISILQGTLGRGERRDPDRACDCYVSLHRSEGFGRGMAEAMLLGKPVIATGHSGNMDFTLPGTAALVDHRPKAVTEEDYPFGDGQIWAEPDVDHAAWWMRRLVAEPGLADRLASAGRALTRATYAPERVGEGYAAALGLPGLARKTM